MAKFELPIYGDNDEIEKTFETDIVRWGVLLQALELQNSISELSAAEQFNAISDFVKKIFPTITDEQLAKADINDVMNTFKQLVQTANQIGGGTSKNAQRTAAE